MPPLLPGAQHRAVRGVRIKSGGEGDKGEPHCGHAGTIMLAGMGVGKLMNSNDDHEEDIEIENVAPSFFFEIVELQGVVADFGPMANANASSDGKRDERKGCKPSSVDKPCMVLKPGEKPIRIESREKNQREVAPPSAPLELLAAFFGGLLHEENVFFLRRFVPEAIGFKLIGKFANLLWVILNPSFPRKELRDFLIRSFAIE